MTRKVRIKTISGLGQISVPASPKGADVLTETLVFNPLSINVYTYEANIVGDINAFPAGDYDLSLPSGIQSDEVTVGATDGVTYIAASAGGPVARLAADGIDAILVESGITAGAGLTNDSGTQLTSINLRQAFALALSALCGVISGVTSFLPIFKQAGKPAGATRLSSTTTSDGRTSVTLKVPD